MAPKVARPAKERLAAMRKDKKSEQDAKLKWMFDSYVDRTYFLASAAKFYHFNLKTNKWNAPVSKELFLDYLVADGFFKTFCKAVKQAVPKIEDKTKTKKKTEAQVKKNTWEKLLHEIVSHKQVDWVGELAGIPPGLYRDNGQTCLITKGPTYVEPKEGACSWIDARMQELLPGIQVHIMEALMARMLRLKQDPKGVFFCQIPILVGDKDCGKSLFKEEIFTPLLGGRYGDCISFISGGVFNGDLARCDVWGADDQGFDTRYDLDVVSDRLKKFAADLIKRIEKKHATAINVHIKAAMIILLNTGSKHLRLLPERSEDIEDKLLAFLCGRMNLPEGEEHEKKIQKIIRAQLPAYTYKLLHKRKPPKGVERGGRFGIVPYYNPELLTMREEEDYSISILELIQDYVSVNQLGDSWSATPGQIFKELTDQHSDCRVSLLSLCKNPKALGWQLSKLARIRPELVIKGEHTKFGIRYTFAVVQTMAPPPIGAVRFRPSPPPTEGEK
jgi:hypothetical protein